MPFTVLHKRSNAAAHVPLTSQLAPGEIAINTADGLLYFVQNVVGVLSIVTLGSVSTAVLSGLSTASNAVVVSTDSIVVGVGKLQAQVSSVTSGGAINNTTVGAVTPSTGAFTTLSASGVVSGAGFVASHAAPGPIGNTTASTGAFTTLSATGLVSGAGFVALHAAPGPIGNTTASTGAFTTLSATGAVSGAGFVALHAAPGPIGNTTPSTGSFSTLKSIATPLETSVAMAANAIDCNAGSYFTKTISGATTLTISNVPAAGLVPSIILVLTNGGSAVITWWSGMTWAAGTAPVLTAAGIDVLGFFSLDGGTTWRGLLLGKGMA